VANLDILAFSENGDLSFHRAIYFFFSCTFNQSSLNITNILSVYTNNKANIGY